MSGFVDKAPNESRQWLARTFSVPSDRLCVYLNYLHGKISADFGG
jgi:hypothetical protein